jgi:hypothetical protein
MSRYPAAPTLARLKDFQRRTVDYVFERLYGSNPTSRFLVADEVGLGKTLVARGVIAKALEHLDGKVDRIDIVYVCSNAAIARQNVARLNVLGQGDFSLASRLTLLPTQVKDLRKNPVNFVSFTPGTTFDLKSRSGVMLERSVLYRSLLSSGFDDAGLLHLLQGPASKEGWEHCAKRLEYPLDAGLAAGFQTHVHGDAPFSARLAAMCAAFHTHQEHVPSLKNEPRYQIIGELRQRLARVCLNELEPDLIVLDEFQRFKNLLDSNDASAELAQALFSYPNARVLLLSATPYKMLSLDHEKEDDHYPDFLRTLRFLHSDNDDAVTALQGEIAEFRRELLSLAPERTHELGARRDALVSSLRTVMCRTERVAHTRRQDAMVTEPPRPAPIRVDDLHHADLVIGASQRAHARDAVEYWKSAPYPLNFMKGYELRNNIDKLADSEKAELARFVHARKAHLLRGEDFEAHRPIDPANARLRSLFGDTLETGLWRLLWIPPSLPYWRPEGPFADASAVTKALVFSAWNVVPDAIAGLCSYEAQRRAVEGLPREIRNSELYERLKPLLRFGRDSDDRPVGMPALLLQYPSPTLASLLDPVAETLVADEPQSLASVLEIAEARVTRLLAPLLREAQADGPHDERWYWAAPALLDGRAFPSAVAWAGAADGWRAGGADHDEDPGAHFREHVDLFASALRRDIPPLGRPPEDLARVLAELSLAGPAVCAARSLRRVAPELAWDDTALLEAASQVGAGFRTLFNVPESIALLRGEGAETKYWQLALRHGLEGNLAALLDEQVHVLLESEGLVDHPAPKRVAGIASQLRDSLSVRTSQLSVDEIQPRPKLGTIDTHSFKLRCRFALRFGELKDEKSEARVETVRAAFNSPFRPFVLASTSVGQEGLDFHVWCHAVVHWNLPSNPVDLEQREGRVHRYKGHAVRRNVALALGRRALRERWHPGDDPWAVLFAAASAEGKGDLVTFWVYETEGGARVERRVPLLPMSRDAAQLERLKRGLALYRLVFGQPRQEDLLAHLGEQLTPEQREHAVNEWRIDLTPPAGGA